MRSRRFFVAQSLQGSKEITLESAVSKYVSSVLRLHAGDEITLFNGDGGEYPAVVSSFTRNAIVVQIGARRVQNSQSPIETHLGIVVLKSSQMDYSIQKATELGVNEITPLLSERCSVNLSAERQVKRLRHWRQVSLSSCEQCNWNYPPTVHPVSGLSAWLNSVNTDLKIILSPEGDGGFSVTDLVPQSVTLLIGPEGGFTDSEVNQAVTSGFLPKRLGPRTLRADTVPAAALTLVQFLWGDLTEP